MSQRPPVFRLSNERIEETRARVEASERDRAKVAQELAAKKSPLDIDSGERVALRLKRLGHTRRKPGLERLLGPSNLVAACVLQKAVAAAKSVARIRVRDESKALLGWGTGFMVSPALFLTNNHVLASIREARFSQIEFNYQDGVDGRPLQSSTFELDPDRFFVTDVHLDFTVVAVSPDARTPDTLASFGFCRLVEQQGKILLGEALNIIQHPSGEPKQLALRENQLEALLDDFLHYHTDTAPGSSGSPVFNDQWEVVGLHHSGVPETDDRGDYVAIDGTVWNPSMGEHRLRWRANEGVRVSRIVRRIRDEPLRGEAARLRDQVFAVADPSTSGAGVEAVAVPRGGRGCGEWTHPGEIDGTPIMPRAQTHDVDFAIEVPLRVTLSVGPAGEYATRAAPARTAAAGAALPPASPAALSEAEAEALVELEQARRRPYYDAAQDARERDAYYEGIAPGAADGALCAALSDLVARTHTRELRYSPARHVYPWLDLQPNGKLKSVYSGREYEPEDFIRGDLRTEAARLARVAELLKGESVRSEFDALDLLEAALPYNCEHVVPQSWFGKQEPMRGDLHHLFACESGCNSFRGNTPYFDFPDFEEAVRSDCGKREGHRFEPAQGKGVVARATLYFMLRYPGEIDRTPEEYHAETIETLLAWHESCPVTLYEYHRNAVAFRKQGNRNPLIDHPGWAREIAVGLQLS